MGRRGPCHDGNAPANLKDITDVIRLLGVAGGKPPAGPFSSEAHALAMQRHNVTIGPAPMQLMHAT
ncbi:MAG: hypothetical protein ACJA1E_000290 [Paracoccaceae bacterium]|jgi:hypothetical protein